MEKVRGWGVVGVGRSREVGGVPVGLAPAHPVPTGNRRSVSAGSEVTSGLMNAASRDCQEAPLASGVPRLSERSL